MIIFTLYGFLWSFLIDFFPASVCEKNFKKFFASSVLFYVRKDIELGIKRKNKVIYCHPLTDYFVVS